jgi:dTDP-4-amino-4,6-dideoxygalactose transaminase
MMMPTREQRSRLIDHLRARGVMAVFHYQPLHLSPMGRRFGGAEGQCPISEQAGDRLVRLPLFSSITDRDTEYVLESVTSWASC